MNKTLSRKFLISLLFTLIVSNTSFGQTKGRYATKTQMISFWLLPQYSMEDQQFGINLKGSYIIENFMHLNMQGTYFHPQGEKSFQEYRAEVGMYFFLFPKMNFSPFTYMGYNYGVWKRNWDLHYNAESIDSFKYITDESYSIGFGLSYIVGKHRLILENRYQPNIHRNYTGFGLELRIFQPEGGFKLIRNKRTQ